MTVRQPSTWNELIIDRWASSSAPAVVDDDGELSGADLLALAAGAAAWFHELGFAVGDAVPALVDEHRTSIAMVVGGALSRRPVAPLGTKLPADELTEMVGRLGARHLFVDPGRIDLAEQIAASCGIELVVVDRPIQPGDALDGECSTADAVAIVHTSGTTGTPKPVRLAQGAMVDRVEVYADAQGALPGDRYCTASPFYHTAGVGMDVTMLAMGVAIIPQDWFSIDNWRRAGRLGVTIAGLVPTMIDILLDDGSFGDAHPRVLQYGAMPIHPDTMRAALDALPDTRLLQIFGQTEASPLTFLDHDDHLRAAAGRPELLRSVGRALPGVELAVENPDETGIGEIAARATHLFQHDDDGWRRTGDLGVIDDGYLYLHGRVNDRIIRGGENIYPDEIEVGLVEHPGVREAAVVGVPDRRWGEIVKAVVVATDPARPPDADTLRAHLAGRVARFKIPERWEYVMELPRTPSGKILRRQLDERRRARGR